MKYFVTFNVEAKYTAVVEADSLEDALEKANDNFSDADLGECEEIDGEPIFVGDAHDKTLWSYGVKIGKH